MELDFTGLAGISSKKDGETAVKELEKNLEYDNAQDTAQEAPGEPLDLSGAMIPKQNINASQENLGSVKKLQRQADAVNAERERARKVYATYQENIKQSSQLQGEILKGIKEGEDLAPLFLKAMKIISNMTGNTALYIQAKGDIRAIYGKGLKDPGAISEEIEEAQERLQRLQEALEREDDKNSKQRIKGAIKAHRELIERLKEPVRGASTKRTIYTRI